MSVTRRDLLRLGGVAAGGALLATYGGATTAAAAARPKAKATFQYDSDPLAKLLAPVRGKFNPPIKVTTVTSLESDQTYNPGDSPDNNPYTRAYKEKYGIIMKHLWQVPNTEYSQKVDLMLTSGQLPDYFMVDPVQFGQLAQAHAIQDLTSVFKKHVTPDVLEVMNESGPQVLESAKINGKLMALPFSALNEEGSNALWVRTDLLKKYGVPEPTTMANYMKYMAAAKADGKYSMAMDETVTLPILNAFHGYQDIWLKKGGSVVFSSIQPEVKEGLRAIQTMFKNGMIDPDFGSKTTTEEADLITSGKLVAAFGSFGEPLFLQPSVLSFPGVDWKAYPIPSHDGKPTLAPIKQPNVEGYWVARHGFAHPEAMLMMMDFFVKVFYATTQVPVFQEFNQSLTNVGIWEENDIATYREWKNADLSLSIGEIESGKLNATATTAETQGVYQKILDYHHGDKTQWEWARIYEPPDCGAAVTNLYRSQNRLLKSVFNGTPTPTMISKQTLLTSMEQEAFTSIIKGAPISQFDTFVSNWKDAGGEQMTKEVNEWYRKQGKSSSKQ